MLTCVAMQHTFKNVLHEPIGYSTKIGTDGVFRDSLNT